MKRHTKLLLDTEPIFLRNASGQEFLHLTRTENYIEAKWQGYITADDVVAAGEAYLSVMQHRPCPKLLNDKSDVTGDWIDANAWLVYEWLPQVVEAGLRCMTHVYSKDMFSQISMRDLSSRISPHLQISTFTDRDQAIKWLLSCKTDLAIP
jgi:hypothetical protein